MSFYEISIRLEYKRFSRAEIKLFGFRETFTLSFLFRAWNKDEFKSKSPKGVEPPTFGFYRA